MRFSTAAGGPRTAARAAAPPRTGSRRTPTHGVTPYPHAQGSARGGGGAANDEEAEASGPSASTCGRRRPPARAGRGSAPGAPRTPGRPVPGMVPDPEEDGRAALCASGVRRLRPAVRTEHFRSRSSSQAAGACCPAGRAPG